MMNTCGSQNSGDFTLDSFNLVPTRRPVQTIKKVARGEAVCALIDDGCLLVR